MANPRVATATQPCERGGRGAFGENHIRDFVAIDVADDRGRLLGAPREGLLLVPADAVIRSARGDRVLVRQGSRFIPVPVVVGQRYADELEIVDGLGMADEVVVSGQFLLDAEASLSAGMARMGDVDAAPAKDSKP